MNKTELITYLRDPSRLSSKQLEELEEIVNDNPYFLSARLLLAKASKEQQHPATKKRIASAAIYSTDRVLLKKYLNGNLFFLSRPAEPQEAPIAEKTGEENEKIEIASKKESTPQQEAPKPKEQPQPTEEKKPSESGKLDIAAPKSAVKQEEQSETQDKPERTDKRPSALKEKETAELPAVPDFPTGDLDSILEDLQRDMENLKASREKFAEVQQKIEEDDAVSAALEKASGKTSEKPAKPPVQEKEIEEPIREETLSEAKKIEEPEAKEEAPKPEPSNEESDDDVDAETRKLIEDANRLAEETRKTASNITNQALEAARKAKEEVALEEESKAEEARKLASKKSEAKKEDAKALETESKKERPKQADPEEKHEEPKAKSRKEDLKEEKPQAKDKPSDEDKDEPEEERAEKVIREPRFSRFASRSYLKPQEVDFTKLPEEEEKQEEKKAESKKEEPKKEDTQKDEVTKGDSTDESDSSKIKLPDLSKARPVPRKNKRRVRKIGETDEGVKEPKDKKEEAPKEDMVPKKEVAKKEIAKPSAKAAESTSSSKPKKATAKKESTKKTTKAKSTKTKSTKTEEEKKDDDKSDRKDSKELIDKFIKESPTIKYQRKDDTSAEDLAEKSSLWDPNLASEYLAEIYLHQGNKKRAIEIYEALSLKYPEKKSYFADLISKIE